MRATPAAKASEPLGIGMHNEHDHLENDGALHATEPARHQIGKRTSRGTSDLIETPLDLQLTRPHPQGELFLLQREGDHFEALVYNSYTTGVANIVPDDLANMYQGCIDGVNNFDPWQ